MVISSDSQDSYAIWLKVKQYIVPNINAACHLRTPYYFYVSFPLKFWFQCNVFDALFVFHNSTTFNIAENISHSFLFEKYSIFIGQYSINFWSDFQQRTWKVTVQSLFILNLGKKAPFLAYPGTNKYLPGQCREVWFHTKHYF